MWPQDTGTSWESAISPVLIQALSPCPGDEAEDIHSVLAKCISRGFKLTLVVTEAQSHLRRIRIAPDGGRNFSIEAEIIFARPTVADMLLGDDNRHSRDVHKILRVLRLVLDPLKFTTNFAAQLRLGCT